MIVIWVSYIPLRSTAYRLSLLWLVPPFCLSTKFPTLQTLPETALYFCPPIPTADRTINHLCLSPLFRYPLWVRVKLVTFHAHSFLVPLSGLKFLLTMPLHTFQQHSRRHFLRVFSPPVPVQSAWPCYQSGAYQTSPLRSRATERFEGL